ncbi:WXG100 family type VII secretion target [Nocardia sp. NPDC058640]|uniref:WXG100 family type VII secretion target n=1 Tax=Nocardia sp. NPDC058640 TaxID=3346571 RepID=UPI00366235C8
MSSVISANFDGVADNARRLIADAERLAADLQDFHKQVDAFFQAQGGQAKEAVIAYQATWNQHVQQLNETLQGAGRLVNSGNSELQDKDKALAGLF